MKRIKKSKEYDIKLKGPIYHYQGDIGYWTEGQIGGHKFSAGLADGEWGKNGWNCGRIQGVEHGEEYNEYSQAIKIYLDTHCFPPEEFVEVRFGLK